MSLHPRKMNSAQDATSRQAIGYMIDKQGKEIPITEQMIQRACADLHDKWIPAPGSTELNARG